MYQFNTMNLKNEYGLSCVEDYTLYLLAQKNEHWQLIFSESYMQFDEVIELMCRGQTYSYFTGVPRLHKTGEKLGLLSLSYIDSKKFPFDLAKDNTLLIQISDKFMEDTFNKKAWRSDHYIMLQYNGKNDFCYLNDIPPDVGSIKSEKIDEIYRGSTIFIDICENVQLNRNKLIKDLLKSIEVRKTKVNYITEKVTFESLRDAIGITKVLTKRMQEYVKMLNLFLETDEYYDYLSACYIKTEYMRKKGIDNKHALAFVEQIKESDGKFREKLLQALNCRIYI